MAGNIYHSFNGTILTITSDSGTSSADLKGDTGCRGPQGPAGVVYGDTSDIVLDGYATEQYVDDKLANLSVPDVDLTDYYTKSEVDAKIANSGGTGSGDSTGGSADLSNYYTKSEVDSKIGSVPAIEDEEGNILTTTVVDYINYNSSEANTYVEQLRQEIYDYDYATMEYVNNLALGGGDGGGSVDLSNYVERTELDEYKQEVSDSIDTVYEHMNEKILYSTTDLTAGTSSLATGVLYVVYE